MEAEYEIWADFGLVCNNEKRILDQLWATFEGSFFMFSWQETKIKNLIKSL